MRTTAPTAASRPERPLTGDDCFVSLVIVSWNTRDLLRECVTSALAAGRMLDRAVEIIVVDNASSDGSASMVRAEFPQIRVIGNTSNVGFAAATNQGVRESRGRYVMLLNPDTSVDASFLKILVSFADAHSDAGAVGPRLVGTDGRDQASCFPLPTLGRELWRLFNLDRVHPVAAYPHDAWGSEAPRLVESIQGACMLIRREALEQVGLLDERFFIYTEEIDLCRRFLDAGWKIYWVPRAVIVHYGGASTRQVEHRMFIELYRSKIQYFRKHLGVSGAVAYKLVLLVAALPRLVVPPLAMALLPSRRETWRGLFLNYSSLLKQLPAL